VKELEWPSPFTRIGPAFPNESDAHGGNCDELHHGRSGLGVWCLNADGLLEDCSGTSFAAPLLSREAAIAFLELQRACAPGTRIYAATVKAFLALAAVPYPTKTRMRKLSERTLGFGKTTADRIANPTAESAVFIWQGLVQHSDDIVRINVPIPREWLDTADQPRLRIACAWDTPVNSAARSRWGCRKMSVKLRPGAYGDALDGSRAKHPIHPLWVRQFDLDRERLAAQQIKSPPETWTLEVAYEQSADYLPSMEFAPQQRVGLALELFDAAEEGTSPQAAVQALPIAATLIRLSQSAVPIAVPIKVRGR